METRGADPGAPSHAEAQWKTTVEDNGAARRVASDGEAKAKLARTECLVRPATILGDQPRPPCH